MSEKTFIYLVLSETGPDGGRIVTSSEAPKDLVEPYEADHPGWYVKRVWSVGSVGSVAGAISAIKTAYPQRSFA